MKITKKIVVSKEKYLKQVSDLGFIDYLFKFITSEFNPESIFPYGIKIDEVKGPKQNEAAKNFEELAKTYKYAGPKI
jgi:hypothetical protein